MIFQRGNYLENWIQDSPLNTHLSVNKLINECLQMFKWLVKSGNYTLLKLKSDMLCQSRSTLNFVSKQNDRTDPHQWYNF